MDLHADSDPEVIVLSTSGNVESSPVDSPRASRRASGFGGSGGEGRNQGGDGGVGQGPTVYFGQPEAREPSAFRTIRLGDLNLVKEFKEMCSSPRWSVVGRQTPQATVRRVYKAKLEGRESGHMTVAVYEGDGAEETWNEHLANYELIRHPNVMQLYGLVRTKGLHAMVFHDELIPYDQFLRRFKHSSVLTTYIIAYCQTMKDIEFNEASDYIDDISWKISEDLSVWIRSATGELCLDPAQGGPSMSSRFQRWWWPDHRRRDVIRLENLSLDAPDSEDIIISSLSEDQYHELCSQPSIIRCCCFQVSTEHPVGLGIFQLNSQCGTCVSITEPLQTLHESELHCNYDGNVPDELLPNSWIRYDSHWTNTLRLELRLSFWAHGIAKAWLAQANCISAELEKTTHVEDYVCVPTVEFTLRIADERDIPEGYLFVCPPQDFRTHTEPHVNLYQWPACPAYWSLDPSGADRLSTEDARNLGFPAIHIETMMSGDSWDRSVYEGLRRFHEGKGFDPDSREVARRLGYPLYEVLSDCTPFLAREVEDWPYESIEGPATCAHARRRRNGMEATMLPVQLRNPQDAAASGSSVDLSLGLIVGGVPMVMRIVVLMAGPVNAIFAIPARTQGQPARARARHKLADCSCINPVSRLRHRLYYGQVISRRTKYDEGEGRDGKRHLDFTFISLVVCCQPPSLLSSRTVGPPCTLTFTSSVSYWSPPRGVFNNFSGLQPSFSSTHRSRLFSLVPTASFPPLLLPLVPTSPYIPAIAAIPRSHVMSFSGFAVPSFQSPPPSAYSPDATISLLIELITQLVRAFTLYIQSSSVTPASLPRSPPRKSSTPRCPFVCTYCSDAKHLIKACPLVSSDIRAGLCQRNPRGRVVLPSGLYVPHSMPGPNLRNRIVTCLRRNLHAPLLSFALYLPLQLPLLRPRTPPSSAVDPDEARIAEIEREITTLRARHAAANSASKPLLARSTTSSTSSTLPSIVNALPTSSPSSPTSFHSAFAPQSNSITVSAALCSRTQLQPH
ncbi:Transposon Tf2-12 polyprotein [Mycena sanguinolenta]|uniref:Transposon Tf2-12 polyprotein n=1 Tax=Mycena sanguinolenta TaxID=230812 RepID=A0A8H7CZM5_9AGAR|nr:Transposon Tf2-12 polyprotein [Mycena sanguinolenta]